jgi:hypothetical protein
MEVRLTSGCSGLDGLGWVVRGTPSVAQVAAPEPGEAAHQEQHDDRRDGEQRGRRDGFEGGLGGMGEREAFWNQAGSSKESPNRATIAQ